MKAVKSSVQMHSLDKSIKPYASQKEKKQQISQSPAGGLKKIKIK